MDYRRLGRSSNGAAGVRLGDDVLAAVDEAVADEAVGEVVIR